MNHQGSGSLSVDGRSESNGSRKKNGLTNLFIYIEAGNYERAAERAESHPGEVKIWVPIPIKPSSRSAVGAGSEGKPEARKKRLPLHHACLKVSEFVVIFCTVFENELTTRIDYLLCILLCPILTF